MIIGIYSYLIADILGESQKFLLSGSLPNI